MARKKKKKRSKNGLVVTQYDVTIECYDCGVEKIFIRQPNEDVDEILDREAKGWYTLLNGIARCPRHAIESGATTRPLHLTEKIHGDPEAHQLKIDRIMEYTRRVKERLSWKSQTSEDSTTSETS